MKRPFYIRQPLWPNRCSMQLELDRATIGTPTLDRMIGKLAGWKPADGHGAKWHSPRKDGRFWPLPAFTRSLTDAQTLVPDDVWRSISGPYKGSWRACVESAEPFWATTPALALCRAWLHWRT